MAEKKVANSVVALSSAAVLAIYGAGYARTREAADRFAQQATERRPRIPAPRENGHSETIAPVAAVPLATATAAASAAPPTAPSTLPSTTAPTGSAKAAAPAAIDASTPKPGGTSTAEPTDVPAIDEPSSTPAASMPASSMAATPALTAPSPVTPPPPPAPAPAEPAKPAFKDGTYYGWGTSRHGDIQAAVVIEEGRITVARVEKCLTRYSCSWITPIPPRILTKQSTTYDYVSGATESSDAFQDAVSEALSQAK